MSDVNVLTRLVLLHFGSSHQLINCYGPEQTGRREKRPKWLKNATMLIFCASYPDQMKQNYRCESTRKCLVHTSGLELPLNQPKWTTG